MSSIYFLPSRKTSNTIRDRYLQICYEHWQLICVITQRSNHLIVSRLSFPIKHKISNSNNNSLRSSLSKLSRDKTMNQNLSEYVYVI